MTYAAARCNAASPNSAHQAHRFQPPPDWLLAEVKGPNNADLQPNDLDKIHGAFEAAGISRKSMTTSIGQLIRFEL
jgi:hypothetical protein